MAQQNPSDNTSASLEAVALNPDGNTLLVTLKDGTNAFEGKYHDEVHTGGFIYGGAILGTHKYCENFNPGDSTTFNAEVDVLDEDMITFINTKPTLGGSAATAEFKGKGNIRQGEGTA